MSRLFGGLKFSDNVQSPSEKALNYGHPSVKALVEEQYAIDLVFHRH